MGCNRDLVVAHLRGRRLSVCNNGGIEISWGIPKRRRDKVVQTDTLSTTNVTESVAGLSPVYGVVMVAFRTRTIWLLLTYVGCVCC